MTTAEPTGATADVAPVDPARAEAVRGLEDSFSELVTEFRRYYTTTANAVSEGMLAGTLKILITVARSGPITLSALVEKLASDKGLISRGVSELEELGLVERTTDPHDGRVRLIAVTEIGRSKLEAARAPYVGRLFDALRDWPVDSIVQFRDLLHALATGETPTRN